jgi:hypothetical protein
MSIALGGRYTDANRNAGLHSGLTATRSLGRGSPVRAPSRAASRPASYEYVFFDDAPQLLDVKDDIIYARSRIKHRELFPAATIGFSVSRDSRQVSGDIPQDLVASVVTKGVVKILKVVYVDHRYGIRLSQTC